MQRFFIRHLQPVGVILARHAVKPPDRIQRQIDRIEFDVRQCVDQDGAPFRRVHRAAPDRERRHQFRPVRLAGDGLLCRQCRFHIQFDCIRQPGSRQQAHTFGFADGIGFSKPEQRGTPQLCRGAQFCRGRGVANGR